MLQCPLLTQSGHCDQALGHYPPAPKTMLFPVSAPTYAALQPGIRVLAINKIMERKMTKGSSMRFLAVAMAVVALGLVATTASAQDKKPNILIIWGDDIGYWNISAYNQGMMGYETPNIDRIAKEGMLFTHAYGEQSCTAGRASFITGQSGFRTGLLKVGLPGAKEGMEGAWLQRQRARRGIQGSGGLERPEADARRLRRRSPPGTRRSSAAAHRRGSAGYC